MAEGKLNLKVDVKGKNPTVFKRPLLLDNMVNWIQSLPYDDYIKAELIKVVKSYPSGSYPAFKKDLKRHIDKIQKNQNK